MIAKLSPLIFRLLNKSKMLSPLQIQQLIHWAQQKTPQEICGLISQDAQGLHLHPLPNTATTPENRFEMDAIALLKHFKRLEAENQQLYAIYHSHPAGSTVPSDEDIRQWRQHYPNILMLIIGLHPHTQLSVWKLDQQAQAHRLHDVPPPLDAEEALPKGQVNAIILSALLALALLVIIALSLLPPAPMLTSPMG